jgi:hypothetical protein
MTLQDDATRDTNSLQLVREEAVRVETWDNPDLPLRHVHVAAAFANPFRSTRWDSHCVPDCPESDSTRHTTEFE